MSQLFHPAPNFHGQLQVPGDKSISHRALLFAALADGATAIENLATGGDVAATARILRQLGVDVQLELERVTVHGKPLSQWQSPKDPLDCGNSGTTMRLLTGVLAGANGLQATLTGDASLQKRPMLRIVEPLRAMGATVELHDNRAPIVLRGQILHGVDHTLNIASAQVKTALLLAGLHATGITRVREPVLSRDHTERMLGAMAVQLQANCAVTQTRLQSLGWLSVPGDPSSAAFLIAGAVLHRSGNIEISQVCLNPTRLGFVRHLQKMGADVGVDQLQVIAGEPVGVLRAKYGPLKAADLTADDVPATLDELPILALCAAAAIGTSHFHGLAELRLKESDRLEQTANLLQMLGIQAEIVGDTLSVVGAGSANAFQGGHYAAGLDHRMAMTAAIAGICGGKSVAVADFDCVASSWPTFSKTVEILTT